MRISNASKSFVGIAALFSACIMVQIESSGSAYAYTCDSASYRGQDFDGSSNNADGVVGSLLLPDQDEIKDISNGSSFGDVFLTRTDGVGGFVQLGWYVGSTGSGLDPVTSPHLFYGQSVGAGEVLHSGRALDWGSTQIVKIVSNASGGFNFKLGDYVVGSSGNDHFTFARAAFVGELNGSCQKMNARAKTPDGDPALKGQNQGTIHVFNDNRQVQRFAGSDGIAPDPTVPVYNTTIGGVDGTDHSYGGNGFR